MVDDLKFPKVLVDETSYGDDYNKDCVFTHPEALISLGKSGFLDRNKTYLEPACGIGNLSGVLTCNSYKVTSSDIMPWGYGDTKDIIDYPKNSFDVVITNPPYSKWETFIRESIRIARNDVFLLFPLRYLEGQYRSRFFHVTHLTEVLIFAYRVRMYRPTGQKLSGLTAYAWFHWDSTQEVEHPIIKWLYR